eukprot:g7636.t1
MEEPLGDGKEGGGGGPQPGKGKRCVNNCGIRHATSSWPSCAAAGAAPIASSGFRRRPPGCRQQSQLRHSLEHGLERSPSVCVAAARLADPDVLAAARSLGCPLRVGVAVELARRVRTGELKKVLLRRKPLPVARNMGVPWDDSISESLAYRGLLETLTWAEEERFLIIERTTKAAAGGRHLEIVKGLHWLSLERGDD